MSCESVSPVKPIIKPDPVTWDQNYDSFLAHPTVLFAAKYITNWVPALFEMSDGEACEKTVVAFLKTGLM
jgi:hypothetical protein